MSDAGQAGEWYYTEGDRQVGPVLFAELVERARAGVLNPRGDMVTGPGLAGWTRAGEVEGLFERRNPAPEAAGAGMAREVAQEAPPVPAESKRISAELVGITWPGVTRRGYFLGAVLVPVLVQVLLMVGLKAASGVLGHRGTVVASFVLMGLATAVSFWAVLQRLANLGMTRWWFFGLFVPLLNLWLGYRCFACPAGYACFRKLDGTGWLLAVLYWLAALALLALFLLMSVAVGSIIEDPVRWREIMERLESSLRATGV